MISSQLKYLYFSKTYRVILDMKEKYLYFFSKFNLQIEVSQNRFNIISYLPDKYRLIISIQESLKNNDKIEKQFLYKLEYLKMIRKCCKLR